MNNEKEKTSVSVDGTGFTGLLTLLFIGLKLGGVVAWSWWWVLSPLWIPLALSLPIFFVVFAIAAINASKD